MFSYISAQATVTYVQGGTPATDVSNTVSCSTTSSVTAGNLVLFFSKESNSIGAAVLSVASSSGPTISFTSAASTYNTNGVGVVATVAWGVAPTSGALTMTGTWSGGGAAGFVDCSVAEFHSTVGWITSNLTEAVTPTLNVSFVNTCALGPTSSTANATDLIVGVCYNFNSAQTYANVSPYTFQSASSRNTTGVWWQYVTSTGAQSLNFTQSSDIFIGYLLAFKEGINPPVSGGKAVIF